MAWTTTTLKQSIQDYLETDEATFVAELDNIILAAEKRIILDTQLPNFKKTDTLTMASGTATLAAPSDLLTTYHLAINNSGYEFLLPKETSFIRSVYPVAATTGTPKYYALLKDDTYLIGPTPDSNYSTEVYYLYAPTSISATSTTWLGTNAENLLLSACLYEGYLFQKGEGDLMAEYEKRYSQDLGRFVKLSNQNRTDQYRSG